MQYGERSWTEISDHISKVVVVPLGSMEQHGHHLPLLTDSMIATEIARQAEIELNGEVLFTPTLWIGSSHHHNAFPGTISLPHEVYIKVLTELMESLISAGFRRILLLNAHGGNADPAHIAMEKVQLRHSRTKPDLWIAFASWVRIVAKNLTAIPELKQTYVSHACEVETSMILRLRPELVKMDAAQGANTIFQSEFYCPDESKTSRVSVARAFEQVTKTGALGHPELGSAEKGKALFSTVVKELVAFVFEFASWQTLPPE